jgi:hypothetical protein
MHAKYNKMILHIGGCALRSTWENSLSAPSNTLERIKHIIILWENAPQQPLPKIVLQSKFLNEETNSMNECAICKIESTPQERMWSTPKIKSRTSLHKCTLQDNHKK